MADSSELSLASEKELVDIAELKKVLEPELTALAADGNDFPHTTGDIFMTRVLRGNGGSVEESAKWYRRFVDLRKKFDLDRIHKACEAGKIPWKLESMPNGAEISKHLGTMFDQDNLLTPGGHLLWFDAMGDYAKEDLLKQVGEENYLEFMHYSCERRTSILDQLSREQKRMVKIVRIMDFEGVGMWLMSSPIGKLNKAKVEPVALGTSVEVIHVMFMTNFPSWALRLWSVLSKVAPPRLLKRIRLLGANYAQDPELDEVVGMALVSRCMRNRRLAGSGDVTDDGAVQGTGKVIHAGGIMERTIEVAAGQRVVWKFRVGTAADAGEEARGLLGKALDLAAGDDSALTFSVGLWPDLDPSEEVKPEDDTASRAVAIEAPKAVDVSAGEISGSAAAPKGGVVVIRWSNQENWVRAKVLQSFSVSTEANEGEVDVDDVLADVDAAS